MSSSKRMGVDMFRLVHVIDMDIDRHGMLMMWIKMQVWLNVAVVESPRVTMVTMAQWKPDGVNRVSVTMNWNVNVMLTMSM